MLSLVALALALSDTAEARHPHRHGSHVVVAPRGGIRFTIGIGPWSPSYVPAPRPGYRWVAGYYVRGVWHPGYWEPVSGPPAPGMVWVPGHWEGERYVDGYWRSSARRGEVWVEGHYDGGGRWVEGRWSSEPRASSSAAPRTAPSEARDDDRYERDDGRYDDARAYDDRGEERDDRPPEDRDDRGEARPEDQDYPPTQPVEVEEEDPDESHAPPPRR